MSPRTRRMLELVLDNLVWFMLVFVLAVFSIFIPNFFQVGIFANIIEASSVLGVMSIGLALVIIAGHMDLSVESVAALSAMTVGILFCSSGIGIGLQLHPDWLMVPVSLAIALAVGGLIGVINGILSTYGRLPSLIATLGMLSIVRGAALILTNGQPVTVNLRNGAQPSVLDTFNFMGQGYLFGIIPMQLVFFAIIAVLAWLVLSYSNFGFRVYAVGGSAKAARVSGISVNTVKIWAFVLMGLLAAFAGILSLAFLPSGQAGRTGLGLELDVIAATIVGGASLSGGEGTILGTILGVLIIGVMRNGLVLMGVSPFVQELMIGLVIIIAVGIDKWTTRRTA